jgi:5-methylcytosine-specific restriction enzyme subunit McrC
VTVERELHLQEAGASVICAVDAETVEWLARTNAVTAIPAGRGAWELRARQKVGVVRVGETTVWIRPKLTIDRLFWLMGWSRRDVFSQRELVGLDERSELVPALAEAFCNQVEYALGAGLLQGYTRVETTETVLRGRLRADEQLRRRFGMPVPLAVRYDDYLVDIPENQILKAATVRLMRLPGVSASVLLRLRKLRSLLVDVSDLVPRHPLPRWHPNRLNVRYHNALWLANLMLADRSLEQHPGTVRVDGFLLDLSAVFENFVTKSLSAALESIGGQCEAQHLHSLDEEGAIGIRPDLVWRINGCPVAVIDAKYKAERPAGFPQADVYQALAYAIAYDLDRAHLIYAKGNEVATEWTVRHSVVRLTAHTLDLSVEPATLLGQVDAIGRWIYTGVISDLPSQMKGIAWY